MSGLFGYVPDFFVYAVETGVEVIFIVIGVELVRDAVDGDFCIGDPVAVASDHCSKVTGIVFISGYVVIAEQDVLHRPISVWYNDRNQCRAVICNTHPHAAAVFNGIYGDGLIVSACSE